MSLALLSTITYKAQSLCEVNSIYSTAYSQLCDRTVPGSTLDRHNTSPHPRWGLKSGLVNHVFALGLLTGVLVRGPLRNRSASKTVVSAACGTAHRAGHLEHTAQPACSSQIGEPPFQVPELVSAFSRWLSYCFLSLQAASWSGLRMLFCIFYYLTVARSRPSESVQVSGTS